ncbi:ABC transporter substrate-binding protein [Patulibacter sp. NPDC049589]|uniref:ABC transporter substrate-binding protein n=1 Tax=Patulibacter sp. NPDC049589 TaxID=3154731 RepID=UPI00341D91F8
MPHHHRLRRAPLTALAIASASMALAACGGSAAGGGSSSGDGASSNAAASTAKPKEGGNLTFLIQDFPSGFVSSISNISSYEGNLWGEITDKLVYVDEQGKVSPWVLDTWETEDDAKRFVLHIKPGVTFSDGEKLDAEAVVQNLNVWARGDKAKGVSKVGLFPALNYQGAKAVDDQTVEVSFSKPTLGFIPTLGYHGSILLSPKTLDKSVGQQADLRANIGSGPFVVKSYKKGVQAVLVKRKDYTWGPPALKHTGPAYLDSITYKVVADASTRQRAVAAGDAQVDFNPNVADIDQLRGQGLNVATPRYLGFVNGFQIKSNQAPFDDVRVRQALQHAIDRQQILSTIYPSNFTTVAKSFVQSGVKEVQDESALIGHDPEQSKKLLDAAGWKVGAGGVRFKNGKPLTFNLIPNPYVPSTQQEDELISQQLAKVGFKAPLKIIPLSNYAVVQKPPIPPVLPVSRSFVDFSTVSGVLTGINGGEDWFGVGDRDKTLNELSRDIQGAATSAEREKYAGQVQKYLLQQGYFIPILDLVQRIYLTAGNVQGVTYNGLAYANFYTAWLS